MREMQETRIQGTALHPLKIYRMQSDANGIDVVCHWQETVEILLVQSGVLDLRIGEAACTGRAGDVFYVNPHQLHSMRTRDISCRYLAFLFPASWLQFAQNDEANVRYLNPLAERKEGAVSRIPAECLPQVRMLLEEIAQLYFSGGECAWLGIKADLLRMYLCLYRAGAIVSLNSGEKQQTLLQIPQYIREHCAEKLTLARMGEQFHLSPKYFSVYFQKHFDSSFADYLTAVRVERAKILLLETENDLELIAQQTGFSQSGYLIRVFRKLQGITPAEYRRQCSKNQASAG